MTNQETDAAMAHIVERVNRMERVVVNLMFPLPKEDNPELLQMMDRVMALLDDGAIQIMRREEATRADK